MPNCCASDTCKAALRQGTAEGWGMRHSCAHTEQCSRGRTGQKGHRRTHLSSSSLDQHSGIPKASLMLIPNAQLLVSRLTYSYKKSSHFLHLCSPTREKCLFSDVTTYISYTMENLLKPHMTTLL